MGMNTEIAGDDRIVWENTKNGVIAKAIHPLLANQSEKYVRAQIPEYILPGDRLRKIDYVDIYNTNVTDTLTRFSQPGKIFIYQVERKNPQSLNIEVSEPFVVNAYHLTFSFNKNGNYWRIMLWIIGIGLFIHVLVFLILLPLLQDKRNENRALRNLQVGALLFFLPQFVRYVYWILGNENTHFQFEKAFIPIYVSTMATYSVLYLYYEWNDFRWKMILPSIIGGILLSVGVYKIVFIDKNLKTYHEWIETVVFLFFYLHVLWGNLFSFTYNAGVSIRQQVLRGSLVGISLWNLAHFSGMLYTGSGMTTIHEDFTFVFGIVQFLPAFSAASLRLKFGRVSVVLTGTMQYLIFFAFALFVVLLVHELFQNFFANGLYRHVLEAITSLAIIFLVRAFYLANEPKIRKYFILSQQQKEDNIRAFLAKIPQYASAPKLKDDLIENLKTYLNTDEISLWWKGELGLGDDKVNEQGEEIYPYLSDAQTIWAKNKEISGFYFPEKIEVQALQYALIFSMAVNDGNQGLLLFRQKKQGVYNLTDLEIIGQLLQQTRLTLNVLQLIQREKELLEQTYQANLTVLRAQINPHFLFNTLNTISALIHDSPDLAEDAIEKLAFIFRYTLKTSSQNFVPFSAEMQLVKTYLEIEQIRFGKRLEVSIDVEEAVESIEIPAFVVQTIIENCIKHGIAKIVEKGIISIAAYKEEGQFIVEIHDNGPGIVEGRERKGTGLNNIIVRMESIYHQPNVIVFENTGKGTLVTLQIPI
jgi:signal transduction histidine kinase